MTSCGTATYTDPDDYRWTLPGVVADLVLTGGTAFRARMTWLKLRRLTLVMIEEVAPRIAFLSLDPSRIFVSFPLQGEPVWDGRRLCRGDFVLHGSGERLHHVAHANLRWGLISISAKDLAGCAQTLRGVPFAPPETAQLLRPARNTTTELLQLHARACRLAATSPDMMAHREVARSVEEEVLHALVNMLTASKVDDRKVVELRRAHLMVRLEDTLAAQPQRLGLSDLCEAIGVSQTTLRICCRAVLACGPLEYARIRRLNQVRSALSKGHHKTVSVTATARSHGFSQLGRFAGAYRALFGETPSATVLRASVESA
jgi:AraC-like DNA-binding protein